MAQERGETTVVREEVTGVEGKMAEATTAATSLALQEEVNLENEARAETPGTSRAGATAARQPAGGAQMTTWIVTVVTSSAEAGEGIRLDTKASMLPSRSSR